MTTPANQTPPQTAVVVQPKREIRVVEDDSPAGYMLDTAKFEHCYRVAEAMSQASLLPKHLKGANPVEAKANCFLVVNQAMAWKLNPFLIMGETYEVQGKLGFQGKLIISVMNTRAGLREKLNFEFNDKKGDDLAVTVYGRFIGEDAPRTVTVSVGQVKTQNQMWVKDPEQKLIYTGAIRWARRHAPEVVMGVMIEEDMEAIREEAHILSLKQIKSPAIPEMAALPSETIIQPASTEPLTEQQVTRAKGRSKRPTMVEEPLDAKPLDPPKPVPQDAPATNPEVTPPQVPASPPSTPTTPEPPEAELLRMAAANAVPIEQLVKYMKAEGWIVTKRGQTKISEVSPIKLNTLTGYWKKDLAVITKKMLEAE